MLTYFTSAGGKRLVTMSMIGWLRSVFSFPRRETEASDPEIMRMANKNNKLITFPMRLPQEVERLFDEIIHRPWGFCREIRGWNPSVDLYEAEAAFILEADLPGVKPEDVKVEVNNGELILQGWRSLEQSHREGQFHTMERSSGHFVRRIRLPEHVDESAVQAEFHEGVLRVIVPKLAAKKKEERRDEPDSSE